MRQPIDNNPAWTGTSDGAATALSDFTRHMLRVDQGAEAILVAVQQQPDEAGLQLAAAFFWLFGQTAQAQDTAAGHLAAAHAAAATLDPHERAWLQALDLWHAKSFDAAATAFEQLTLAWPDDLLALRAAEFLYYVLGQQFSGPRFVAHTERLAGRHGGDSDFLAIHAFANGL